MKLAELELQLAASEGGGGDGGGWIPGDGGGVPGGSGGSGSGSSGSGKGIWIVDGTTDNGALGSSPDDDNFVWIGWGIRNDDTLLTNCVLNHLKDKPGGASGDPLSYGYKWTVDVYFGFSIEAAGFNNGPPATSSYNSENEVIIKGYASNHPDPGPEPNHARQRLWDGTLASPVYSLKGCKLRMFRSVDNKSFSGTLETYGSHAPMGLGTNSGNRFGVVCGVLSPSSIWGPKVVWKGGMIKIYLSRVDSMSGAGNNLALVQNKSWT